MRNTLLVAASFVALTTAAGSSVAAPAVTAAAVTQDAADAISDADLRAFASAMGEVQTVAAAVEGTPTARAPAWPSTGSTPSPLPCRRTLPCAPASPS